MLKIFNRFFSGGKKKKPPPVSEVDFEKYAGYHLIFPDSTGARLALGERFLNDGDVASARQLFERAMADGGDAGVVASIEARWFYDRGEYASAFEKAQLALEKGNRTFLNFMIGGASAYRQGKRKEALQIFIEGSKTVGSPSRSSLLAGIATTELENGNIEAAQRAIQESLAIDPRNESALLSSMLIYDLVGNKTALDQSMEALRRWHPDSKAAQMNMGTIALSRGDYPEGWRLREARLDLPEFNRHYLRPSLRLRPRWDGKPFAGKRLLVFCEQGLGDTVMLARFFPAISELGGTLIVECQPEATALLRPTIHADHWLPIKYREEQDIDFDFWVPSMSLPGLLGIGLDNCIPQMPYLRAAPDALEYWHTALAASETRFRVGIAWSGNPTLRMDNIRSMRFADLEPLLALKDIEFHVLQVGGDLPEKVPENLIDHAGELLTLADTAALASCMDLVLTIDSVLVHVAGALNLPTWLALPDNYEWRWTRSGETTPWYPAVKIFRQECPGQWSDVIEKIAAQLDVLSKTPKAT